MNARARYWWLAVVAVVVAGCATVTETGRRQLLLVSAEQEMQLGLTEFQKLKQTTPIARHAPANAMLQRVGQRIAAVASLPDAKWEFVLFEDPQPNAFCLPGGKVGVNTGILPITRDEAGLATVVGHEVAHAAARHGGERMSEALLTQAGGQILTTALQSSPEKTQNLWQGVYGLSSQVGWVLPHSRKQELEADHIGLLYLARAGYDPRQAVEFWKRFQAYSKEKGGQGWEFLSTHPVDERRIAELEKMMPEALREYQKARR